ncbi:MAG: FAD:protein FMN transferase [Anaerolineae bacterium]|nr:FAD:protein FMN transferase [Anaerolineae bacterium]
MTTTANMKTMTSAPTRQSTWRWTRHDFRAMNTNVAVELLSDRTNCRELVLDVERLFASVERRLSRFKPTSELSQLNTAPQDVFAASPILIDAVEVALWAADATAGLYDPTLLDALENAGYDRSFEQVECPEPLSVSAPVLASNSEPVAPHSRPLTFRSIQVNRARRQITRPAGLRLDLGGMGKGWTVDRAADALQGLGPFLINAGGDLFAYHSPPGTNGWPIDISHPLNPEQTVAQVELHHQALATSTIARRRWRHNGQVKHHLIDPRTGRPAQTDALSVSVMAPRTVIAEVYAKTALILGVERGLAFLQSLPHIEGLIVAADASVHQTNKFNSI